MLNDETSGQIIPCPCGKCPPCLARRVSGWSFRLQQEEKNAISSQFLTLTYGTNHLPFSVGGKATLDKTHVQKFIKRLRKKQSKLFKDRLPIRYFACGEYGSKTSRPHYHIIMFNAVQELIQPAWDLGQIHYGDVSGGSVGYCLKYMNKPKFKKSQEDDRNPEFQLFSKGLGSSYLTPQMISWHQAKIEERAYLTIDGTKKAALPRYYKNKIYTEDQREQLAYHGQLKAMEQLRELQEKHGSDLERFTQENTIYQFKKMYKNAYKQRDKV